MESTDIDWFCFLGNRPIYVSSNGGYLPKNFAKIAEWSEMLRSATALPFTYECELNENAIMRYREDFEYLDEDVENDLKNELPQWLNELRYPFWQKLFAWPFLEMSKRGFFSFWHDNDTKEYVMVSSPSSGRLEWAKPFNRYDVNDAEFEKIRAGRLNLVDCINESFCSWPLSENVGLFFR